MDALLEPARLFVRRDFEPGTTLVVTQPAATTSTRTTVATDFTVVTADAPTANPR
jgi:hypothetical protein